MNHIFDKCYCLHCVESEDRLEHCINEFNRIGLEITFHETCKSSFDAALGPAISSLHTPYYDNLMISKPNVYGGVFSCAYNHYQMVKQSYIKGYNNILITEDDIQFCDNLSLISSTFENMPTDYELLKFYYTGQQFYETDITTQTFQQHVFDNKVACSTLCYALSRMGMKKIIYCVEHYGLMPADMQHKIFPSIHISNIPIVKPHGYQSMI